MHTACLGGQAECAHCCIQHDVQLNALNFNDETPIDMARKVGKSLHIEKASKQSNKYFKISNLFNFFLNLKCFLKLKIKYAAKTVLKLH